MALEILSNLDIPVTSSLLKTDANGVIAAAVLDTDYLGPNSALPIYVTVKNMEATATLTEGTPCKIVDSGTGGHIAGVKKADASSSSLMPAGVILTEDITAGSEGQGILAGVLTDVNTDPATYTSGDDLYTATGGGYTNVKPTGTNLIQNLGIVMKAHATNGSILVYGSGRANAVPNIPNGQAWVGNANSVAVPTQLGTLAFSSATYDNYQSWNLKTNGVQRTTVQSGGTLDIVGGTNTAVAYSAGGVVTVSSTDTNNYLTGLSFNTSNGILTATRLGLADVTVDLDGRFAISNSNAAFNQLVLTNNEKTDMLTSIGTIVYDANDTDAIALGDFSDSHPDGIYLRGSDGNHIYTLYHTGHFGSTQINNWETAFSWGNHSGLYLSKTGDTATGLLQLNPASGAGIKFNQVVDAGSHYQPTENNTATDRYWIRFDHTNNASYPYLTNRTPSGAVVIKTGTAAGGSENEHFRIKGGDGTVDAYFSNVRLGIGTSTPTSGYSLDVNGKVITDQSVRVRGVETGNPTPVADNVHLSGYGVIGNRGTVYLTNAGGDVQIGIGATHNANPVATFGNSITLLKPSWHRNDINLDDNDGNSPALKFVSEDDTIFSFYKEDNNNTLTLTRQDNGGADFRFVADPADYTQSRLQIGTGYIDVNKINTWDQAAGWGDHSAEGYMVQPQWVQPITSGFGFHDDLGSGGDLNWAIGATDRGGIGQPGMNAFIIEKRTDGVEFTGLAQGTEVFTLDDSGNLGLSNSTPDHRLDVNGNIMASGYLMVNNDTATRIGANGGTGAGGGAIIESFDSAAYIGAFLDFTIYNDPKDSMRSGTLQLVFNPADVMFNEVNTMDIGDTTPCTLTAVNNAGIVEVIFTTPDPSFHIKYHVRTL